MVESSNDILLEGCEIGSYDYSGDMPAISTYDTGINITNSNNVMVNDAFLQNSLLYNIDISDSQNVIINESSLENSLLYNLYISHSQATVTWCDIWGGNEYNVYVSGDCAGTVLYRNMFGSGETGDNVYDADTGAKWNSTVPVFYTYDDSQVYRI